MKKTGFSHGLLGAELARYLELLDRRSARKEIDRAASYLLAAGLFWEPPGDRKPRPQPWVARALATVNGTGSLVGRGGTASPAAADGAIIPRVPARVRPTLRHPLVCRPLANLLLLKCLDLEARLHATVDDPSAAHQALDEKLRSKLSQTLAAFKAGAEGSARAYYPECHPCLPDEPVAFASLGDLVRILSDRRDPCDRLRLLRNSLAHGHYCGWRSLLEIRAIDRVIGGLA